MNNILDQFADDVTEINISKKKIVGILDFKRFTKLTKLNCSYNKITSLDILVSEITKVTEEKGIFKPNSLTILYCGNNYISSLDNLSNSLIKLSCDNNKITSLDNLPNSLIELNCSKNQITNLNNLPNSLIKLNCDAGLSDFVFKQNRT